MESILHTLPLIIGIATAFMALTAIGGGVALLIGLDEFPPEWLRTTPFKNYTIPALILSVVVGGSALSAAVLYFTGNPSYPVPSMVAGLGMAGFILVEIRILDQDNPGATKIEVFYLVLGIVVFELAGIVWLES